MPEQITNPISIIGLAPLNGVPIARSSPNTIKTRAEIAIPRMQRALAIERVPRNTCNVSRTNVFSQEYPAYSNIIRSRRYLYRESAI